MGFKIQYRKIKDKLKKKKNPRIVDYSLPWAVG